MGHDSSGVASGGADAPATTGDIRHQHDCHPSCFA
jgi:hypothetical protein